VGEHVPVPIMLKGVWVAQMKKWNPEQEEVVPVVASLDSSRPTAQGTGVSAQRQHLGIRMALNLVR
jgi:hypothetical protein